MVDWDWTPLRREKLSDVLIGLGHVVFGATVLRFFLGETLVAVGVVGFVISLVLWVTSLVFLGIDS